MHWLMHSLGERMRKPSTPISASGECGGSRSTVGRASGRADFWRRVRFKSAALAPSLATESIIQLHDKLFSGESNSTCFLLITTCSQTGTEKPNPLNLWDGAAL